MEIESTTTAVFAALPLLSGTALFAAFAGAVTGGGVTAILMPVLVLYFGIHQAMPIITIALFGASFTRVAVYWRNLDFPLVAWFSLGSLPAAIVGTFLFTITAPDLLTRLLGLILLTAVIFRRLRRFPLHYARTWFLPLGAAYGFLSGVTAAVASVLAPFFLGYGLRKGAFVGTIGLSVFLIQIAKLAVFAGTNFLKAPSVYIGFLLVPLMIVGTMLGKNLVERMSERIFENLMEAVMVFAGIFFVVRGAS